jgi:hypothetical protein
MFRDELFEIAACADATRWVGERSLEEAWEECPRGDWLLWYAQKVGVDRRLLVRAACACARQVLQYAIEPEARLAIETAEGWTRDEVAIETVRMFGNDACIAARDSAADGPLRNATIAAACVHHDFDSVVFHVAIAARRAVETTTQDQSVSNRLGIAWEAYWASLRKSADIIRGIIKISDLTAKNVTSTE